jgi:hypothetical protein
VALESPSAKVAHGGCGDTMMRIGGLDEKYIWTRKPEWAKKNSVFRKYGKPGVPSCKSMGGAIKISIDLQAAVRP